MVTPSPEIQACAPLQQGPLPRVSGKAEPTPQAFSKDSMLVGSAESNRFYAGLCAVSKRLWKAISSIFNWIRNLLWPNGSGSEGSAPAKQASSPQIGATDRGHLPRGSGSEGSAPAKQASSPQIGATDRGHLPNGSGSEGSAPAKQASSPQVGATGRDHLPSGSGSKGSAPAKQASSPQVGATDRGHLPRGSGSEGSAPAKQASSPQIVATDRGHLPSGSGSEGSAPAKQASFPQIGATDRDHLPSGSGSKGSAPAKQAFLPQVGATGRSIRRSQREERVRTGYALARKNESGDKLIICAPAYQQMVLLNVLLDHLEQEKSVQMLRTTYDQLSSIIKEAVCQAMHTIAEQSSNNGPLHDLKYASQGHKWMESLIICGRLTGENQYLDSLWKIGLAEPRIKALFEKAAWQIFKKWKKNIYNTNSRVLRKFLRKLNEKEVSQSTIKNIFETGLRLELPGRIQKKVAEKIGSESCEQPWTQDVDVLKAAVGSIIDDLSSELDQRALTNHQTKIMERLLGKMQLAYTTREEARSVWGTAFDVETRGLILRCMKRMVKTEDISELKNLSEQELEEVIIQGRSRALPLDSLWLSSSSAESWFLLKDAIEFAISLQRIRPTRSSSIGV